MKYFLDSAQINEIEYALDMWDIDGVTTNPRHIEASGKPFLTVVREIGAIFSGTSKSVSVQTNPHNHNNWQAIMAEGEMIANISPNFVVKMPCTENGFKACLMLSEEGIRCNLTVCFSAAQALMAMRMGATYISPFIGWKETNGEETRSFIEDIVTIRDNFDYDTEVLVAAVRNARQIIDSAVSSADIVTAGFAVYKDSFEHPYTDVGLGRFQEFWDKTPYGEPPPGHES